MLDKFLETSQFKQLLEFNVNLNSFGTNSNGLVLNPLQFLQYRTGSNWDYCICEAFKINNEIGIPVKCYSLEIGDDFINFITFKNDLYWYWFESYDKSFPGLHRFKSWIRMINFITHRYGVMKSNFKLGLREINPLDSSVFGMNQEQYKSYILMNPVIDIKNTAIEDPVNYINENGAMKKFSDTSPNGIEYADDESVETKTLTDEELRRMSFNFNRGLKNLKTFSQKVRWNIFIRRFTGIEPDDKNNMADSMKNQLQRLKIKARVAIDQKEKANYMREYNALKQEAIQKGYITRDDDVNEVPKFYSSTDPDRTAPTNDPPKPSNMDHQSHSSVNEETQSKVSGNGISGQGQQGGFIVPDEVKKQQEKKMKEAAEQAEKEAKKAEDQVQQQQSQPAEQPPQATTQAMTKQQMEEQQKAAQKRQTQAMMANMGISVVGRTLAQTLSSMVI